MTCVDHVDSVVRLALRVSRLVQLEKKETTVQLEKKETTQGLERGIQHGQE